MSMSVILAILGIGLLLLIIAAVVVIALLKKGAGHLMKTGGYRRYSSSDYHHHGPFGHTGHTSYGHAHYRRKHASHSGFFSS
jgi:hypothetical protein